MKYLLVFLAFFSSSVFAFNPNDLMDAEIKQVAPCKGVTCLLVEKDGKQYVVMGEVMNQEDFFPIAVYIVEDKKLRLIWSVGWINT